MINDKCPGYTLLEILTVLVIIGIMVTVTTIALYGDRGRNLECLPVMSALNDMKAIQDAIVKGFYPDVGRVPRGGKDPIFTTALSLPAMCSKKEINDATYEVLIDHGMTKGGKLCRSTFTCFDVGQLSTYCKVFLYALTGKTDYYHNEECHQQNRNGILLSKQICRLTSRKYCKCGATINYGNTNDVISGWNRYYEKGFRGPYIETGTSVNATYFEPELFPPQDGEPVLLPAISIPSVWADELEKKAIEAEKSGDEDLAKQCRRNKYYQILNPKDENDKLASLLCAGEDGISQTQSAWEECLDSDSYGECLEKLKITDPDDSDYMDIGDDIVMFVFSGDVRSPLEK
ncbi:MAG: type II secretion system protein [Proteobacteria bacterium]|nr:type II secretion system protein [Pseudomonadota bacterium]